MAELNSERELPETADALVVEKDSVGLVWLVPLLALLIGGWLAYNHWQHQPVMISLLFANGEGLVAGKTEVRYQGITLGVVKDVKLDSSMRSVIATVAMEPHAQPALRSETRFWLVKPEISFSGISGLDTLVTGNYIAMYPGEGDAARVFKADSERPPVGDGEPGLHVVLLADDLGSLNIGSPVTYRKVKIGSVQDYSLVPEADQVRIRLHINPEYMALVRADSRFWNSSGFTLEGSFSSFALRTDSLASIIAGGVAFDPGDLSLPLAKNGTEFPLLDSYEQAQAAIAVQVDFASAEGLSEHMRVMYKGHVLGKVAALALDTDSGRTLATLTLDPAHESLLRDTSRFWLVQPQVSLQGVSGLDLLVKGNYLHLEPGEGALRTHFTALAEPPPYQVDAPGLHLIVHSTELPSVTHGAPVLYRKVPVGEVKDFAIRADGQGIDVRVVIAPEFGHLVRADSRFWNASGFSLSGGLSGVSLRTESVAALISGGLAFFNPAGLASPAAANHSRFELFDDYDAAHEQGELVRIRFATGDGLAEGTAVRYRGVQVGEVKQVRLVQDARAVQVTVLLKPDMAHLAREGTRFWRVSAALGLVKTEHLDTLIKGDYIALEPGTGEPLTDFVAQAAPPVRMTAETGLNLVLTTSHRGSLAAGTQVTYRQMPVGQVTGVMLADTAHQVEVFVVIEPRFAALVRTNSQFWLTSGVRADFGWFSGLKVRTDSLESVLAGGIALGTPEELGAQVQEGARFTLHDEPQAEWEAWSPLIALPVH